MDTPSSATLLKPRLRLLRRSPSPRSPDAASDATPQAGPSSGRMLFPNTLVDDDEQPTPRMHTKPIASFPGDLSSRNGNITTAPTETPAARLRALLAREPRSPKETPTTHPPAPPSEADSIAGPSRFGSSTSSVARESLKDIFSRALREPGDTPQKGRPRRNSFDGSSMEITPVVDRERGKRRIARQSLSDEEDKPKFYRDSNSSFRSSPAATFDTLRARLMSSQSQPMDQNALEPLYFNSSLASTSQAAPNHHLRVPDMPSHHDQSVDPPTVATDILQPSFQMSSQFAFQSNLLDQDSEMQRAMGDVINSESEVSTSAANPAYITTTSDLRPSSSLRESSHDSKTEATRAARRISSSFASSSTDEKITKAHPPHEEQRNHLREREWNRPRTQSRPDTPEIYHKASQESHRRLSQEFRQSSHAKSLSQESALSRSNSPRPLRGGVERRASITSLRSFDDDQSSRPSSVSSQADYRDRISELERERNHDREREWNKRHPPSRPSSSLSTSSNHSFSHSHSHSHSHPPRSPSTTPYLTPTHASLQRKSSRTSLRSDSPSSLASSHESLKEREQEEKKEVEHERERNWNSPQPKWSTSKSPATSRLSQSSGKDKHSLRPSSSLPHLESSNGHQDSSGGSSKPLQRGDTTSSHAKTLVQQHSSKDRFDSHLVESAISAASTTPRDTQGAASRFGWNFARSPLPPLELDNHTDQSGNGASPGIRSSHIPVRSGMKSFSSVGHATSDMSLTHIVGEGIPSRPGNQDESSEVPSRGQMPALDMSGSQDDMMRASDEESVVGPPPQSTTPKAEPPKVLLEEGDTDAETEVLSSPSQGPAQLSAATPIPKKPSHERVIHASNPETPVFPPEVPLMTSTPPGTPPSALPMPDASTSFSLITPPRQSSFGSSILDFRTPSPPLDLPGPPSSSDDDAIGADGTPLKAKRLDFTSNSTFSKTPKPPGAWAATPLPPPVRRSSSPTPSFSLESTPPAFTSTPLPRSNSHPAIHSDSETSIMTGTENGLVTPVATLSRARARSLPPRTPAPPGAWFATPNQPALQSGPDQSQFGSIGRKKGLLKVRFDVAESEASATEGHPNSPLSAIRLTNPELPLPSAPEVKRDSDKVEVSVNGFVTMSSVPSRSATPDRPTTPMSNGLSPRSVRKSPSVRLVDAYGRARDGDDVDAGSTLQIPNGDADTERPSSTPQRSLVRIVDAMGREVDDTFRAPDESERVADRSLEGDSSVMSDTPAGHAELLSRMRRTLNDLVESLSDADRSLDIHLNSTHLEELEEVSKTARSARNQLAQNLQIETTKEQDLIRTPKLPTLSTALVPVPAVGKSWNKTIIYFSIVAQIILIFAVWRYAHVEAHRLFYTTYYDPLYPEFTPLFGNSCFTGTLFDNSRSWTMLDSYDTIRREGWLSVGKEVLRAMRHVGDRVWEQWGERVYFERPT